MSTFEAAKLGGQCPWHFTDLKAAVNYIANSPTRENEVRPWIRNVDADAFVGIGGKFSRLKDGREDPQCFVQSHPLRQKIFANGLIGWTVLRSLTPPAFGIFPNRQ